MDDINKSKINKGIIILIIVIISAAFIYSKMKVNKYEKATRRAAMITLNNEAEKYRAWTIVNTGKLKYHYTLYNEELKKYRAYYFARISLDDEPVDEYIEIEVELTKNLKVTDTSCCYYDVESYEEEMESKNHRVWVSDKDGTWYAIDNGNMAEVEREKNRRANR